MKTLLKNILSDFFFVSFFTMALFYLIEYFAPGFVVNYFNLNYLFVSCLLSGGIVVFL